VRVLAPGRGCSGRPLGAGTTASLSRAASRPTGIGAVPGAGTSKRRQPNDLCAGPMKGAKALNQSWRAERPVRRAGRGLVPGGAGSRRPVRRNLTWQVTVRATDRAAPDAKSRKIGALRGVHADQRLPAFTGRSARSGGHGGDAREDTGHGGTIPGAPRAPDPDRGRRHVERAGVPMTRPARPPAQVNTVWRLPARLNPRRGRGGEDRPVRLRPRTGFLDATSTANRPPLGQARRGQVRPKPPFPTADPAGRRPVAVGAISGWPLEWPRVGFPPGARQTQGSLQPQWPRGHRRVHARATNRRGRPGGPHPPHPDKAAGTPRGVRSRAIPRAPSNRASQGRSR
jgi:hypothetical protein